MLSAITGVNPHTAITDKTISVPYRTIRPRPRNILVCVIGDPSLTTDTVVPPAGLCTFYFYRPVETPTPFAQSSFGWQWILKLASDHPAASKYGVDISERHVNLWNTHLLNQADRNVISTYKSSGVVSYSVFDTMLACDRTHDATTDIIKVLKALHGIPGSPSPQAGQDTLDVLMIGVSPLRSAAKTCGQILRDHVLRLVRKLNPYAVLFRSTYMAPPDCMQPACTPICKLPGMSIWNGSEIDDQPSMVDALEFKGSVFLPSSTLSMLSFSPRGRMIRMPGCYLCEWSEGQRNIPQCTQAYSMRTASYVCRGGYRHCELNTYAIQHSKDIHGVQELSRSINFTRILAYETNATLTFKMCNAAKQFGFDGSWVIFDMEYLDTTNVCSDQVFADSFAIVHWVKKHMESNFYTCDGIWSSSLTEFHDSITCGRPGR
ncbi:uncharacterized protein LOC135388338 isoform X1 [Ornithodoros turicata]|uniref:uncharacterized protein LOC135388338 isoform X1 n=1 Tax=Ornithodoros turicata TaxID=34597 RepID=UPI0031394C06